MIRTKQLLIEARDSGPKTGPAILLVHGWPDDASAWDGIGPVLNDAGFRSSAQQPRHMPSFSRNTMEKFLSQNLKRKATYRLAYSLSVDARQETDMPLLAFPA
jgi:pimeloyl-ACP methyl ester carboxylesterase